MPTGRSGPNFAFETWSILSILRIFKQNGGEELSFRQDARQKLHLEVQSSDTGLGPRGLPTESGSLRSALAVSQSQDTGLAHLLLRVGRNSEKHVEYQG